MLSALDVKSVVPSGDLRIVSICVLVGIDDRPLCAFEVVNLQIIFILIPSCRIQILVFFWNTISKLAFT